MLKTIKHPRYSTTPNEPSKVRRVITGAATGVAVSVAAVAMACSVVATGVTVGAMAGSVIGTGICIGGNAIENIAKRRLYRPSHGVYVIKFRVNGSIEEAGNHVKWYPFQKIMVVGEKKMCHKVARIKHVLDLLDCVEYNKITYKVMFWNNNDLNDFIKKFDIKTEYDVQTKFYSAIESVVSKAVAEEQTKLGYSDDDLDDNVKRNNLQWNIAYNLSKSHLSISSIVISRQLIRDTLLSS